MTHSGGQPHVVGDRGQRYEVTYQDHEGARRVFGWAANQEGVDAFVRSITLHPTMTEPQVRDRWEDADG